MNNGQANDQQQKRSRKRKSSILLLIIFFTLVVYATISVFTILKHEIDSKSLSANPREAIKAACKFTFFYSSCTKSILSLHNPSHKIQASDVLRLSIDASLRELLAIYNLSQELASKIENKNIRPVLTHCQNLFNDSLMQLNRTRNDILALDEKFLDNHDGEVMIGDLKKATKYIGMCFEGLSGKATTSEEIKDAKERIERPGIYILNSMQILANMDYICEMFDQSFRIMFGSFMSEATTQLKGWAGKLF